MNLYLYFKRHATICINADTAYKLIWKGYPVFFPGSTDQARQMHPFGLAVCVHEKYNDFKFMFDSMQIGLQRLNVEKLPNSVSVMADGADYRIYYRLFVIT